jgi:sterol desaturase/sphingolipid hydroxylase (fatty acid hydroxylase superfamily)
MRDSTKTLMIKIMETGYWSDFYVYPVVVVVLLILAIFKLGTAWWAVMLCTIGGIYLWGFAEYFTHRYLFHHAPLFKVGHDEHHARPRAHLGTPTFITLTAYIILSWPIALLTSYGIAASLLAGFLIGYFGYVICHHIVHNWKIAPGTFLHRYKKFHDIHHYRQVVNFGVSWMIWDRVFGTYQKSI